MRRKRIFAMAYENMKQRRFRTFLTTLGVVIGITAIIGLASLGEGFHVTIKEQMEQGFELNVLTIMSGGLLTGESGCFADADVQNMSKIDGVNVVAPLIQRVRGVKLYNISTNVTPLVLLGVNFTEFWKIYPDRLAFENGSLPQSPKNNTVVLGYNVAHPDANGVFAYPNENITMQISFYVQGRLVSTNYTVNVAGTLGKSGAVGFINFDDALLISLDGAKEIYNTENSDIVFVRIVNPGYSNSVAEQIEDSFPPETVRVLVPSAFMEQVETVLRMLQIFLTSIASIALLVAGLGIMNIMTVSVIERTREIGILKAIGAKNRTVLAMFLTEAMLIGLMGGVLGVPLGYGLAQVLGQFLFRFSAQVTPRRSLITGTQARLITTVTPILSLEWILGAIVFAVGVSVIFGWYPARKAAKLNPVEALRYE